MHLQESAVFALDLKRSEGMNLSDGAKSTNSHRKPTVPCMILEVRHFLKISERLTPENYQILTSSLADSLAKVSQPQDCGEGSMMREVLSSLNLPESLKTDSLGIFYLKMFPIYWELTKGRLSQKSLQRFQNWGTVWNGLCITAQISESHSPDGESILQDVLERTAPEKYYISENSTRKLIGKLNK